MFYFHDDAILETFYYHEHVFSAGCIMEKKQKYQIGEVVLIDWGKWHRGTIVNYEIDKDGDPFYLVHYFKDSSRDDDWVSENLIHANNAKNRHKIRKMIEAVEKTKKRQLMRQVKSTLPPARGEGTLCYHGPVKCQSTCPGATQKDTKLGYFVHYTVSNESSCTPVANCTPSGSHSETQRSNPSTSAREPAQNKKWDVIKVDLTLGLKLWLNTDNFLITKEKKFVKLPVEPNIDKICEMYLENTTGIMKRANRGIFMCDNIKYFFNTVLSTGLLYAEEQDQYNQVKAEYPDKSLCQIYGCHHLLRLFVKLDTMFRHRELDEKIVAIACTSFQDFVDYISTNLNTLLDAKHYE